MNECIREIKERGIKSYPLELLNFNVTEFSLNTVYHWHPEFEILLVHKGGFTVNIQGCEYTVHDGDIFFVSPNIPHSVTGGAGNHKLYDALIISPSFLLFSESNDIKDEILDPLVTGKINFPHLVKKDDSCWKEIHETVQKIVTLNSCRPNKLERMQTVSLLLQLLIKLYGQKLLGLHEGAVNESERIRKIISYVNENYSSRISLGELAGICGLSEKYFCSYFKAQTAETPIQHINSVRIAAACDKLSATRETVTDIALECGFENISYFIRQFSKQMGMPPAKWRKLNSK